MTRDPQPTATKLLRAREHLEAAELLRAQGNEWAAVCCFYAAYTAVRHALEQDPIFDNSRLGEEFPMVKPTDRHAEHHSGNPKVGRGFGVKDLVAKLYRTYAAGYHKLHAASIDVRYKGGLGPVKLDDLLEHAKRIVEASESGALRAKLG